MTPGLIKGQSAIINCFNDVAVKDPKLYDFITKECGDLLKIDNDSSSNIPIDIIESARLNSVTLTPKHSVANVKGL